MPGAARDQSGEKVISQSWRVFVSPHQQLITDATETHLHVNANARSRFLRFRSSQLSQHNSVVICAG